MSIRECGSCTKCCEGWLTAEVNFRQMYPGKPCYLLQIGKGCERYEDRPKYPCKDYFCMWMKEDEIPEEFKPNISGTIINYGFSDGFKFFTLIEAPNFPSKKMILWMKTFSDKKNIGLSWRDESGNFFFHGSNAFISHMKKIVGKPSTNEINHYNNYNVNK